jgi:hypothetical protein
MGRNYFGMSFQAIGCVNVDRIRLAHLSQWLGLVKKVMNFVVPLQVENFLIWWRASQE